MCWFQRANTFFFSEYRNEKKVAIFDLIPKLSNNSDDSSKSTYANAYILDALNPINENGILHTEVDKDVENLHRFGDAPISPFQKIAKAYNFPPLLVATTAK